MRSVIPWPNRCLRTPAAHVEVIDDRIRLLWDQMIEVMDAMPGVGLAATQLGEGIALAVVDASNERGQAIRMANPKVIHASVKLETGEEASPNLPGVSAQVKRPRAVTVQYLNEYGTVVEKDLVGLWARSVQHQIDHLQGVMYFDRLSKLKRDMLIRKARKS